jgi:NADH-quinone oxidoreductase subunit M
MLIPMYFLIGIWGHERRVYAALKFFIYTMGGSALMLVGFLVLYRQSGLDTFDLLRLAQSPVDPALQTWLFLAFALAFAIKVPMWPFHTWLPDAHVEAPTAGSVILAGVLLKMGGYGFLRLAIPLFPEAAQRFAPWIGALAVIGIVYGALVSLVQPDLKKLVAYSSVSHLGFVMLGIASFTTTAVVGAVYQMLNHGISTGALFFLVGMLYDRRHTRAISGVRRPQGHDALVRRDLPAHLSLLDRRAGLQRLHRGVPDPHGLVALQPDPDGDRFARRHPGLRLHPLDGPARALW